MAAHGPPASRPSPAQPPMLDARPGKDLVRVRTRLLEPTLIVSLAWHSFKAEGSAVPTLIQIPPEGL